MTYQKDSADLRETPAVPVARKLLAGWVRLAFAGRRESPGNGHRRRYRQAWAQLLRQSAACRPCR